MKLNGTTRSLESKRKYINDQGILDNHLEQAKKKPLINKGFDMIDPMGLPKDKETI